MACMAGPTVCVCGGDDKPHQVHLPTGGLDLWVLEVLEVDRPPRLEMIRQPIVAYLDHRQYGHGNAFLFKCIALNINSRS